MTETKATSALSDERLEQMIRTAHAERNTFMVNSWSWLRENDTFIALTELQDRRASGQVEVKASDTGVGKGRIVSNLRVAAEEMLKQPSDPAWPVVCEEAAKVLSLVDTRLALLARSSTGVTLAAAVQMRHMIGGSGQAEIPPDFARGKSFEGKKIEERPVTPSDWRKIIDDHELYAGNDADGYQVAADRLSRLISFHIALTTRSGEVGENE